MSLSNGSLSNPHHQRHPTVEFDPFSKPEEYYADESATARRDPKRRTFSSTLDGASDAAAIAAARMLHRRGSLDAPGSTSRKFLLPVEHTLRELLSREDTDSNTQITIDDDGPKVLSVGTAASEGFRRTEIRGTYMLSNLLQELTLAQDYGRQTIVLDEARLNENPVDRLDRMIRDSFWNNLTRIIDGRNIAQVARDPKDWTDDPHPRIYIPYRVPEQYEYYKTLSENKKELKLEVIMLPENVTAEYIRDLNEAPGLLALPLEVGQADKTGVPSMRGKPFVVPGGRFNELYGWDSYMIALGLLLHDRVELAKSMVENFCFCVEHYGKILNANRTYYLGRSQPPFLSDMTLRVYSQIQHEPGALDFLRLGILSAMKEYLGVWVAEPRYDEKTGLSRYRPIGIGVPPETEATHFEHVLTPYAKKHGMTFKEFVNAYNHGKVKEPDLDEYFTHDRAVRESGHDTSYRLEKVAADLATVDLNSCLYKIECDIARIIRTFFKDALVVPKEFQVSGNAPGGIETSAAWDRRAKRRRLAMDKYMWDDKAGMYFDYNTATGRVTHYESATTFWAMWAGVATPRQAANMVIKALPKFEELGGLSSGTELSRGPTGLSRPNRQWDYPFGWAPQQILAWTGFQRYGYVEEAQRLAYKWLFMVTKAFVDFNGVVVEKYDVTRPDRPHEVAAEYGNQGADFKGVPREGFGWVNASYAIGLDIIDAHMKRALGALTPWDVYEKATKDSDVYSLQPEFDGLPQHTRTGLNYKNPSIVSPSEVPSTSGLGPLPSSRSGRSGRSYHQEKGEKTSPSTSSSKGSSKPSTPPPFLSELERQKSAHAEFAHEKEYLRAEKKELDLVEGA